MNKAEIILEKTKAYKSELFEVEQKLLAPEIIADIVETRMLTKKRRALYDIVCFRDNLERILNSKAEYLKELSTADCENKLLLTELLDELTDEETRVTLKILSSLIDTSGDETEELKVEIKAVGEDYGFCDRLLKMYAYFATINELFCQKAGNTLLIKGKNAKMYFESATAIHKWYDTKISTAEVRVFEVFNSRKIEVNPDEVRIDIYLAHGKGGQNINKVETAVRLTHLPTNTVVTCQDERSQLKNKERAFLRLRDVLQQKQDELIKKQEEQQQEYLTKELRKNQRNFFVSNGIFIDSRVDTEIDLNLALKGNINEIVEAILLENIG